MYGENTKKRDTLTHILKTNPCMPTYQWNTEISDILEIYISRQSNST